MSRVVWAEETKNGLGFEIGPSYDNVATTSQRLTDVGQSSSTDKLLFLQSKASNLVDH